MMKRLLFVLSLIALLHPLSSMATNELFMSDVVFTSQGTGELSLYISNASEVTAFQITLHLPEGIVCRDASLTERAAEFYTIPPKENHDNSWINLTDSSVVRRSESR